MTFKRKNKGLTRSLLPQVAVYTVFGVLWITLSDRLLLSLIANREFLSRIQTYKGWLFILITSILLYFLMARNRKRLLNEKTEQESILSHVPIPLVIVDSTGKIRTLNPAFTDTFGYELRDIPDGETWFRKAYPDEAYRKEVMEEWQKTLDLPQEDLHPSYTFTVVGKNGRERVTEFMIIDRADSRLMICRDLTGEKKQMAENSQEEKMRALGQLAGGIAHDFNNQLSAIMGYADLLRNHIEKGTEESGYLDSIIKASDTSAKLTKELLSYSRKTSIEIGPVNMKDLLNELVSISKRTFPASILIELQYNTDKTTISGNQSQISSMLLNLLLNAKDAMPGGGNITVALTSVWQDTGMMNGLHLEKGLYLVITVSDEGKGIAPENISHIFEPFFTTKERYKGSGMGLAMVYSTLQYHKGGIEVESSPGKGTTFRLFFPTNLTVPG